MHKSPDDVVLWGHLRRLILNKAMTDLQPQLALDVSNRVALFRAVNAQKRIASGGVGDSNVMADLQEALKLDAVALLMSGREKKHVRLSAVLRAQSYARKLLHYEPCDAVAWFLLAACHYSAALLTDHVTEHTLHQLNTLFDTCQHHRLAPHYVTCFKLILSHIHMLLAVTTAHVTHRDRALALLTELSQVTLERNLQSDTSRHLSLAHSLHAHDKQSKAALVHTLRTDPRNRVTWLHLAQHYVSRGQSAAALECFTRARGLFRTSTVDYVALTLKQIEWLYRSEQYLKALKACDELAQHCATHHYPAPAVLHIIQALVAANLNHKSKIQPALSRAVAADPSAAHLPIVAVLQQYAP